MPSSSSPLRVGLKLIPEAATIDELRGVWQIADESGFHNTWGYDHLLPVKNDRSQPVFDGWTLLGATAECTSRVRIGVLVTGNSYRHPGQLAKMAATVDHLSGGRLEFAIGAGWAEYEHHSLGLEYGTVGDRIDKLGEAVQIIRGLWTQPVTDFAGRHYQVTGAISEPKPVQRPHPPIWMGGRGERKTLALVARYADAWNLSTREPVEDLRLDRVLDEHCDAVGRDPTEVRRTFQVYYAGDADETLRLAEPYLAAGSTEIVVTLAARAAGRKPLLDAATAATELLPRPLEMPMHARR